MSYMASSIPIESKSFSNRSIKPMNETLTDPFHP